MLGQNYPNPFSQETEIEFNIPTDGRVTIQIEDMIGRVVAMPYDQETQAGSHSIRFSKANLGQGVFTYTLIWEGNRITRRMIIAE